MKRFCAYFGSVLLSALPLAAQPVVNAIENNYSFIPAGLPSYGIAQGSIFVIFGTNLAQKPSGLQSVPLKAALDGVTVQFSVQGSTTQALLYYVTPTQIGGILPSATPLGTGTVTVTNGGQSSAAAPITVVQSAIGIFSLGSTGPAVASEGSKPLLPGYFAANPGETITFYGTGAGPVSGDESSEQTPQNLSSIPIDVEIGGVSATVSYHGRSKYPGLDQFNVVVPQGPVGCTVSVLVRSGNYISNSALIPVASTGRICSDPDFGTQLKFSSNNGGSVIFGTLSLGATETIQDSNSDLLSSAIDAGSGDFEKLTFRPGAVVSTVTGGSPFPSLGGCIVTAFAAPAPLSTPPPSPASQPPSGPAVLDAGMFLNFTGPNGLASLWPPPGRTGAFGGPLSLITGQVFIPPQGGSFTIDNGSGGKDISGFHTQLNFPPLLTVSNAASLFPAIDRSQPLTLQWTGGDPKGFVEITGHAALPPSNNQQVSVTFECSALASAGQFKIPASILMALPPMAAQGAAGPAIEIGSHSGVSFTAPGVDAGMVNLFSNVALEIGFE